MGAGSCPCQSIRAEALLFSVFRKRSESTRVSSEWGEVWLPSDECVPLSGLSVRPTSLGRHLLLRRNVRNDARRVTTRLFAILPRRFIRRLLAGLVRRLVG